MNCSVDDQLDKPILRNVCSKLAGFVGTHLDDRITHEVWWVTVDGFLDSCANGIVFDLKHVMAIIELGDCFLDDVDESRCEQ